MEQFGEMQKELARRKSRCLLIAGVNKPSQKKTSHDENTVQVHVPDGKTVAQHKHHRWKLTQSQIMQYNLGGVLNPNKEWWEHIDISDRTLTFVSLLSDLTLSVLICEDLARPDPVADVVRVVGPNLVIALLMDGPQLKERWPTRHAIALADDPRLFRTFADESRDVRAEQDAGPTNRQKPSSSDLERSVRVRTSGN
jgi:hypothetical protein